MINGRVKGHTYERKWANYFKSIGYKQCVTSRLGSRLLDNSKVDLVFIPYLVQLKHDKSKLKYEDIFLSMQKELTKNFPKNSKELKFPKIIIHRFGRKRYNEYAVIPIDDFKKLLKRLSELDRQSTINS